MLSMAFFSPQILATAIVIVHLGVVAFNIFGLVIVPIGGWQHWEFVRGFTWRLIHLLTLGIVALQAALGRACLLTIWESDLMSGGNGIIPSPMIARFIDSLLYWPLPLWVFTAIYIAVLIYAVLLWRWVPPRPAWKVRPR